MDELTQLGNRRKFEEFYEYQWELCLRNRHYISFIIMDIDHFKLYNDSLGHPEGDKCLERVSQTLKGLTLRATDLLVRLGGEEFGLLLPETAPDEAEAIAGKIIDAMEEAAIPHPSSPTKPYVTLSVGAASGIPKKYESKDQIYKDADAALYKAKRNGRNMYKLSK